MFKDSKKPAFAGFFIFRIEELNILFSN